MCDNAARIAGFNHLKHTAGCLHGAAVRNLKATKNLWERAGSGRRSDESSVSDNINVA